MTSPPDRHSDYTGYYHPGDVAPINVHFNETLSGYEVWAVYGGAGPGSTGSRMLRRYYRNFDENEDPDENHEYTLDPGGLNLLVRQYDEEPWEDGSGPPPDNLPLFMRKAGFTLDFVDTNSEFYVPFMASGDFHDLTDNLWYDIVVRPYFAETSTDTLLFGQETRFANVIRDYITPPQVNDFYGPIYRWKGTDLIDDDPTVVDPDYLDPDNAAEHGIRSVVQTAYDTYEITITNADDVTTDVTWNEPFTRKATYRIYARNGPADYDGIDPPLFIQDNMIGEQTEAVAIFDLVLQRRVVKLTVKIQKSDSPTLPWMRPGQRIWFGARAFEVAEPWREEFVGLDSFNLDPNMNKLPHIVEDQLKPYFIDPEQLDNQSYLYNQPDHSYRKEFTWYSTQNRMTDGFAVFGNPAIDTPWNISGGNGGPMFPSTYFKLMRYKLYVSADAEITESDFYHERTIRMSDYYYDTGNLRENIDPFNFDIGPAEEETYYPYRWTVTDLPKGSGMPVSVSAFYYTLIVADDMATGPAGPNFTDHEPVEEIEPGITIHPPDVGDGLPLSIAACRGAISAFTVGPQGPTDIHILRPIWHPEDLVNFTGDFAYSRLPDGMLGMAHTDTGVLSSMQAIPKLETGAVRASNGVTGLSFDRNGTGDPILQTEDNRQVPVPVASCVAQALADQLSTPWGVLWGKRVDPTAWSGVYVNQGEVFDDGVPPPEDGPIGQSSNSADTISYAYYDRTNGATIPRGLHCSAWIKEEGGFLGWIGLGPLGDLRVASPALQQLGGPPRRVHADVQPCRA